MLYHFLYASRCTYPRGDISNLDLLREAEPRNRALGITGLLLRGRTRFLQVIEGPDTAVLRLAAAIERDPRHFAFRPLGEGPLDRRYFPEWHMGYADLDPRAEADLPETRERAMALLLSSAWRMRQSASAPSMRALTSSISPSPSTERRSPLA